MYAMQFIDLSLPVDNQMPGVSIEPAKRLEVEGWNATTLRLYSHSGTHMDAPSHFIKNGRTLDQQPLHALIGEALVVDLTPVEPKQLITIEQLSAVADEVQFGCRLLLRTDWYQRYGTTEYRHALPRVSLELAHWLVERRVALLGVEPPSVADVNDMQELTEVHRALFQGNVVVVEGLANLDRISSPKVHFIALPLKIMGGDGSPVRAVAIQND